MAAPASHARIEIVRVGPITHLRIGGVIDETFSLQDRSSELTGHILVDLGRVERISSFGVRKWIEFAARLPTGAFGLYLIHVPPVIVDQLNMVEGFAGIAVLRSVLAPYRCHTCKEDRVRPVDLLVEADALNGNVPVQVCSACGKPMEFAERPEEFFDYARHQALRDVDPAVDKYLQALHLTQSTSEITSHLKIVQDDITFFRVASTLKANLSVRPLTAGVEGRVAYDFGIVHGVEAEASARIREVIAIAAKSAKVFLWRVPPALLVAFASGEPPPCSIVSVWLPCECPHCGGRIPQRVEATAYLQMLRKRVSEPRPCAICGGPARLPLLAEVGKLLEACPSADAPLAELEAIEPRALSQSLAGGRLSESSLGTKRPGSESGVRTSPRLHILRRLGQGGMAEVFLARQAGLKGFEKYLVVKKVLGHHAESPEFVEMLFAEARANARLTHPNIVQTYDVGVMDGAAYITMEYVRGPDLKRMQSELRKANVALPVGHALRIAADTAAGLHYAHSYVDPTGKPHPVVHRDVSPHNILLSLDGAVKLSDFGIAKVQGESNQTQPGVFKGKVSYSSPEAIREAPLDGRNDVFSLGVVLFEMLTGQLPFKRSTEVATLRAILQDAPPVPSQLNPAVSPDIGSLVLRALEKDPAHRFQSADDLREEIESAMVRHGLRSSAKSVAAFLQEKLGERLQDFSPSAVVNAAQAQGLLARPETTRGEPTAQMRTPGPAGNLPKRTVTPGFGIEVEISDVAVPNVLEPESVTVADVLPALTPSSAPKGSGGPEPESGRQTRTELKTAPELGDGPRTVVDRPMPVEAPFPAVAPSPLPPPFPKATGPAPRRTGRGPRRISWVAAASMLVLLGAATALAVRFNHKGRVPVANLPAEERLYVGGLRVNPNALELPGNGPWLIAVARDGRLARFGEAERADGIDVRSLVEAPANPGGTAQLLVESVPSGCEVTLDGKPAGSRTPLATSIEAGRELSLEVSCPGSPTPWQRWILAIPGQSVQAAVSVAGS